MASTPNFETVDLEEAESRGTTPHPQWTRSQSVDGSGALNFRGLPAVKRKTGGWIAASFIHLLLTADGTAIFGISGNLVPYLLDTLHMPFAQAVNLSAYFMGITFLLPIFWGYLADTYLGNYWTIGTSSIICFSGLLVLFSSTTVPSLKPSYCVPTTEYLCPESTGSAMNSFMAGLFLTAIGASGLLPCATSMGQEQFDETDKVEKKKGSYFFTSYYGNINLTALFCVTVLFYVQSNKGYDWGYGVITGMYFVCVAIFFVATRFYRHRPPSGSALTRVGQVFVASFSNMRKELPTDPLDLHELDDQTATKCGIRKIAHTDRLRFLDKAAIVPPINTLGPEDSGKMSRKLLCTVTQVEELKSVIQILPIWVCCISVYTVFAQLVGVTLGQAASLDRKLGKLNIPPGSTLSFLMITAMFAIVVYEFVFVPIIRKWTGHPRGISDLKRMGVALFLAILSMIAAAFVEGKRVEVIAANNITLVDLSQKVILPMKFYWLFPQFGLLGLVEFLLGVAQLNFFYSETPDSMRGIATSLYFTSVSVGYFVSAALVETVNKYTVKTGGWLYGELITGGLKKFYLLLAVIMVVNWLMFLLFSHWYTYKKVIAAGESSWKNSEDDSKQNKEIDLKVQVGATVSLEENQNFDETSLNRTLRKETPQVAVNSDETNLSSKKGTPSEASNDLVDDTSSILKPSQDKASPRRSP